LKEEIKASRKAMIIEAARQKIVQGVSEADKAAREQATGAIGKWRK
jgi:hypothetical protein